jgi:hypothetical protein
MNLFLLVIINFRFLGRENATLTAAYKIEPLNNFFLVLSLVCGENHLLSLCIDLISGLGLT